MMDGWMDGKSISIWIVHLDQEHKSSYIFFVDLFLNDLLATLVIKLDCLFKAGLAFIVLTLLAGKQERPAVCKIEVLQ